MWVVPAAAQTSDAAMAESLFREGKRLSSEKNFAQACPKFQESYRLDPGLGTLLNLATCHESEGKLASAWAEFSEASSQARRQSDNDRAQLAQDHMKSLEPKLAHVSIAVSPPAVVPGLVVKFDGKELAQAAWSLQIPIDPGQHVVDASAPGKQSFSQTFETPATASALAVTVPPLQDAPVAVTPPAPPAPAAPVGPVAVAPATVPPAAAASTSSGSHTGAIVAGVATGAFAVGTVVTGILYSGKRSDFKTANDNLDPARFDQRNSAATLGTVNLVCAGGTLVSAGLLVYFLMTAGSHESAPGGSALNVVPLVAPSGGGLVLRGSL
jgi:hypothetical protein